MQFYSIITYDINELNMLQPYQMPEKEQNKNKIEPIVLLKS